MNKGKKVTHLKLVRLSKGYVQPALLWYNTFLEKLSREEFNLNGYDPCVENKMIGENQYKIFWYADDTKISYNYPRVEKVM